MNYEEEFKKLNTRRNELKEMQSKELQEKHKSLMASLNKAYQASLNKAYQASLNKAYQASLNKAYQASLIDTDLHSFCACEVDEESIIKESNIVLL